MRRSLLVGRFTSAEFVPSASRSAASCLEGGRTYKGRVAFEGSFVFGQSSNFAVVEELASLASLMSVANMIGVMGCQEDWAVQQSDALQAYTQSELKGVETWIFLPRDQWSKGWD